MNLAGVFNHNGVDEGADGVVWRKNLGTKYTQDDYYLWRDNFGQPGGSGASLRSAASLSATVPEPASALTLLVGLLVMCLAEARPRHKLVNV